MCTIYKCNDRVELERKLVGWAATLEVRIGHRDQTIDSASGYHGSFPCYLICDFVYPYCGPDYVSVSIVSSMDDLDMEAE